jgi:hypothetical protein
VRRWVSSSSKGNKRGGTVLLVLVVLVGRIYIGEMLWTILWIDLPRWRTRTDTHTHLSRKWKKVDVMDVVSGGRAA